MKYNKLVTTTKDIQFIKTSTCNVWLTRNTNLLYHNWWVFLVLHMYQCTALNLSGHVGIFIGDPYVSPDYLSLWVLSSRNKSSSYNIHRLAPGCLLCSCLTCYHNILTKLTHVVSKSDIFSLDSIQSLDILNWELPTRHLKRVIYG